MALLVALCAIALPPTAQDAPSDSSYSTTDPLLHLNKEFTDAYGRLLAQTTPELSPVIIECGSSMTLVKNGVAPAFGRRYRELEAVSHVPVTVYVLLTQNAGKPLAQTKLDELRAYRSSMVRANAALPSADLTPDERARQQRMIGSALKFVDHVLAAGNVSNQELRAFAHGQSADITANVRDAARDQIDMMDRALSKWTAAMTPQERAHLKVAVCGPHMPRIGNISMQYFAASLGYPYLAAIRKNRLSARISTLSMRRESTTAPKFSVCSQLTRLTQNLANHFLTKPPGCIAICSPMVQKKSSPSAFQRPSQPLTHKTNHGLKPVPLRPTQSPKVVQALACDSLN